MTTPRTIYKRGARPNQIEFDPTRPLSVSGGNGDLYQGKLHRESHPDGSPFQYSNVALKRMRWGTLDKDMRFESIIKETYVWMGLDHLNLLRFLGLLHDDDEIYLVAPFASQGSLPDYLVAHPDADRRMFLWQIAAGLAYLHSREIVHGDMKGANILVFNGPTAKICDFGLSKIANGRQTTNPQYSRPWTSPERLLGASRSYASDVYAFGMTIYEVLSGEIPFLHKCDPFGAFVRGVCDGMRPPKQPDVCCAGISYVLHWIIAEDCWQEAPESRMSMSEVRDQIAPAGASEIGSIGADLNDLPILSMPPSSDSVSRGRGIDSVETMQSADSSRPAISGRIYTFPEVDERPNYETSQPTSTRSRPLDHRIETLQRAKSASHQAAKSSSVACLPGTRTAVLQKIDEWVRNKASDVPRVFWLNGMAGTGKSTIAKTLAEAAELNGILGASFFFDRQGHSEVRNGELFIPTIAFQLAQAIPSFRPLLSSALEKNLDVLSFTRHSQLQTLLAGPLQAIKLSNPVIVVLDALDECEPRDAKELLLLLLQMTLQCQIPRALRIFISCRPDRELDIAFRTAQSHQLLLLHEVEEDVVQADIEMYITKGLTNPPLHPSLPPDWISTPDLKELTRRSGKLFIYATTVLKYIRDNTLDSSRDRLQSLLATRHSTGESALGDLDKLYLQVLRTAIRVGSPETTEAILARAAGRVRCLLGALVLLRTPLPLSALSKLVAMPLDQMQTTLEHLQSVVMTPKSIDDHPQFLHQSFPDFVIDSNRCPDTLFFVDVQDHEYRVADQCLTVMIASLKRNVKGSTTEMETKPEIKREVAYACIHWASHLAKSPVGNTELLRKVDHFAKRCLLWWVEALSMIGQAGKAASAADGAFKWAILSRASKQTIALLRDAHRFVLAHLACINDDPNHVYTSALPFTPRATSLWKLYRHEAALSVHISSGVEEDWSPCLGVLAGHGGGVKNIAFSPDGTRIASGSEDKTVRVWDAASGQSIAILEGHSHMVTTIAFSPDGVRIVSASYMTAQIWDTASGQCIVDLKGHSEPVTTVAFSPDGTWVVSGSYDSTVRIWDAASGQCVSILEGHSKWVMIVAFSPNGTWIVSGSFDTTVRVWAAASGQSIAVLEGHSQGVTTVAFSPDGTRIASGSEDMTVRIWEAASGQSIAILEGHSQGVTIVAFSPDGTWVVSGSYDSTVRIWDAASGQSIAILAGHSSSVLTVAFSPDGTQIVSGSADHAVRIWDATSGRSIAILIGHSSHVSTVALSPDGARIISGSYDKTIRIWDAASKQCTNPEDHSSSVSTIAFSPDGASIISGSSESTVRIWDAASGQPTATLKTRCKHVTFVAFSPDGTRILSGSRSNTVCIWNAASGQSIATLKGASSVNSIAFSPDGTRIVLGCQSKTLRIWDTASGHCIANLKGHSGWVDTVGFSPDGTQIVSGSCDSTVRVWDVDSEQSIAVLRSHPKSATSVAFAPDGTRVLLFYLGEDLRAWDFTSELSTVGAGRLSDSEVSVIFRHAVRGDGAIVAMLSEWSRLNGVSSFVPCGLGMHAGCLSPDGSVAAVGCEDGRIVIFNRPHST